VCRRVLGVTGASAGKSHQAGAQFTQEQQKAYAASMLAKLSAPPPPSTCVLRVTVPEGVGEGTRLKVMLGQCQFIVPVPGGVHPGQSFSATFPCPPPAAPPPPVFAPPPPVFALLPPASAPPAPVLGPLPLLSDAAIRKMTVQQLQAALDARNLCQNRSRKADTVRRLMNYEAARSSGARV
jgi:hypothetical protein